VSKFGAVESTVFEIPSANLSPERSFSFETGLKSSTGKFSGTLSVYKTFLFDQIDRMAVTYQGQDTIENRRVYQKQNVGESELYGLEADMEFNVSASWVAFGNLTYTYGQNISKDEPMRRIPPLFGKIGLRYQRGSTWWAKTEWLLAGSQDRLAGGDLSDGRIAIRLVDGVMPGWNIVNLYAGIKIKFVSLTASAQNIFDAAYRVYGSGVDGYGRTFWISTTVQF
jgi:outer membrane receptor protein involved in Fe transport